MTQSINKTAATPLTLTAERSYWREEDTPDLPESLSLELTAEEVATVHEARDFLRRNKNLHSVNVQCTPPEIDDWRYDVSYLVIFKDVGAYLFMQGKYDCSQQVEYSVDI